MTICSKWLKFETVSMSYCFNFLWNFSILSILQVWPWYTSPNLDVNSDLQCAQSRHGRVGPSPKITSMGLIHPWVDHRFSAINSLESRLVDRKNLQWNSPQKSTKASDGWAINRTKFEVFQSVAASEVFKYSQPQYVFLDPLLSHCLLFDPLLRHVIVILVGTVGTVRILATSEKVGDRTIQWFNTWPIKETTTATTTTTTTRRRRRRRRRTITTKATMPDMLAQSMLQTWEIFSNFLSNN